MVKPQFPRLTREKYEIEIKASTRSYSSWPHLTVTRLSDGKSYSDSLMDGWDRFWSTRRTVIRFKFWEMDRKERQEAKLRAGIKYRK